MKVKDNLLRKGIDVDRVTDALLKGADPEDDGGVGTTFRCLGNGDCLLNAIPTLLIARSGRGDRRQAIWRLAKKLRLAAIITGIKFMELFPGDQYYFSGARHSHGTEVCEGMKISGAIGAGRVASSRGVVVVTALR